MLINGHLIAAWRGDYEYREDNSRAEVWVVQDADAMMLELQD